jgi:protein-S-isoprenylcysteine O-methyltransferase Ste14
MITYGSIIFVSWMTFLLVWGISSFFVKRDLRGGGIGAMFIFISIAFALRMRREEQLMLELFPEQYPEYQQHTKRLVPFVW